MSRIVLQLVGGGLYLLNKIFLDIMEHRRGINERAFWFWKRWAWAVYLLGMPPIVHIFFREHNWVFGCVELGGTPAMLCGLIAGIRQKDAPKWLERIALVAIPVGLAFSVWDFHSIAPLNHILEFAGSAGFLVGTYLLSRDRLSGYGWFMLMNVATAWLLYIEHYPLFVPQQILSIIFIADATRMKMKSVLA